MTVMDIPAEKQEGAAGAEHLRSYRWPKGTSGNPAGRRSAEQRIAECYAVLAAEYETPTPVERILLDQAARLLDRAKRARDPDIAIRSASASRRLLDGLRRRRIEDAPPSPAPLPWSPIRERVGLCEPACEPAKEPQG